VRRRRRVSKVPERHHLQGAIVPTRDVHRDGCLRLQRQRRLRSRDLLGLWKLYLQRQHGHVPYDLLCDHRLRIQQLLQRHGVRAEESRRHDMRLRHRVRERDLRGPMLQFRDELFVPSTEPG
jgi:hypothetical protein